MNDISDNLGEYVTGPSQKGLYNKASSKNVENQAHSASDSDDVREVKSQIEEIVMQNRFEAEAPKTSSPVFSIEQFGQFILPKKKNKPQQQNEKKDDISNEEVQEIHAQIDEIIHKNRSNLIAVSQPFRKNELVFPFAVNIAVLLLSGTIILAVGFMIGRQDEERIRSGAFSSIEGHLIRQLQQEADELIAAKNREMESMRGLLENLEREHADALADFERRERLRDAEYQEALRRDVETERQRLIAQGYSYDDINEMLAAFERERLAYYNESLANYRRQLENERRLAEENFANSRNQLQNEIRRVNEERLAVQEELNRQRNALRLAREAAPFRQDAGGQELDAQRAWAEFAALNDQRRQIQFEENRITALFNTLRNSLELRRYAEAIERSQALIEYLESTVQTTPDLQQQRNMDIYLAQSLARIAVIETERPDPEIFRARIEELEETNQQLYQQYQQLYAQNQQMSAEADDVTRRIQQNAAEISSLNNQIAQVEAENTRLNEELQNLFQENRELAQNASLNNRIADLEAENSRLNQANQELFQTAGQRAEQLQASQGQNASLNNRIAELEAENSRLNQENRELVQNTAQSADNEALTNRLAQLEEDNSRLNRLNRELSELTDQNQGAQALTERLNGRITELERDNARLAQVNSELTARSAGMIDSDQSRAIAMAAHREGVANTTSILDLSLRISDQNTRRQYLESLKPRFVNEPDISAFIDLLILRL